MRNPFLAGGGGALSQITRLLLGLLTAALVFAAYNYALYNRITAQYLKSERDYSGAVQMKEAVSRCDNNMQDYLVTGNRAHLVAYNAGVQEIDDALGQQWDKTGTPEMQALLRSMEDALYSYQTNNNYAAFYQTQQDTISSIESLRQAQKIGTYLRRYCDDLLLEALAGNRIYYLRQNENQRLVLLLNISLLAALGGGTVLAVWHLNNAFNRPLQKLYRAAQSLGEGDLSARVEADFSEEMLRTMADAFNTMACNVVEMMAEQRHRADLEKQLLNEKLKSNEYAYRLDQANFLALQSQMNPHFMFNTLNSISRTVTLGRNDAAVSMIDMLAELLRYNLQDGARPALLSEEIDIVGKYITIQQFRFGQRVRAEYVYDEQLAWRVCLPRFTLQPLVENAIIHGLEPKEGGGVVTLRVWELEGYCHVELTDDGLGAEQERFDRLLDGGTATAQQGRAGSIGVYNTAQRLRLFTGIENALTITSQPGRGTTAHIMLPMEENDVQTDDCGR